MTKKLLPILLVILVSIGGLSPSFAQEAAMIVSSEDLSAGFDQAQHDSLVALGYDVTVVTGGSVGSEFTIDDANAVDLVLISESISSSDSDPLIGTTTPVMHQEAYGWDNWSATAGDGITWLTLGEIDITSFAHPIPSATGVSGNPVSYFSTDTIATADTVTSLAPGAELVGQATNDGGDYALIFSIDKGAELSDGSSAPARFAGFSLPGQDPLEGDMMTADAWALWKATVNWLNPGPLTTPVLWDFEGDDHDFVLRSLNEATPAADDPETAGDEALTGGWGEGNPDNLPEAGIAWIIASPSMINGQFPGAAPDDAEQLDDEGRLDYDANHAGDLYTGSLNTYMLNFHGDYVHTPENDQIATSPVVSLPDNGGELWLSAVTRGGGGEIAPEFAADPDSGYVTESCGIAVLSATDSSLLGSVQSSNHGQWGVDSLDLSAYAGQDVFIEVVDAFEGAYGWILVDKIQIGSDILEIPGSSQRALIHQYKFDGDLTDAVGNSHGEFLDGNGDLSFIEGHDGTPNGAIDFPADPDDNQGYAIQVGRFSPIVEGVDSSMTVSFWAKWHGSTGSWQDIINKRDDWDETAMTWGINQHEATGHVISVRQPESNADSKGGVPEGVWTHVAVSYVDGEIKFYMNGEHYDTVPYTLGTGFDAMIRMGSAANTDGTWRDGDAYNGALDDVRFYSRILNDDEIMGIYKETTPVHGMVAHWPMDEGSGTTVADVVGGNDGTLVGLSESAWLDDGGIRFDDTDGHHIEVPHADELDFGDESFTISMLVRYMEPPKGEADRWLIKGTHGSPGTGSRYELFHTSGNTARFTIDNGPENSKSKLEVASSAIVTGKWVHVVAVRDANSDSTMLFANGVWQGGTADESGDISNGEVMWIGESTDESGTAMSGDMKDIRIYNYPMSEFQINQLFGNYDLEPLMVAHWPMDEGAGETIYDVIGGNDGTMVGLDPGSAWIRETGVSGVEFNNTDGNHIEVPHADVLDFGDESFSVSMLVRYPNPPEDTDRWFIKGTHGDPGTGSRYEIFRTSGSTVRFSIDNATADVKSRVEVPDGQVTTGDWAHVVAVRDAIYDTMAVYLNSVFHGGSADESGDISNGEVMWIGESTDESGTAMSGQMSDIRVFSYALSEEHVKNLFGTYNIEIVGIDSESGTMPESYALQQNYPNPFNPTTTINFALPQAGQTSITVYNVMGQEVATLMNKKLEAGSYSVEFDGSEFASGVYFYRLRSGSFTKVNKMLLLK